MHYRILYSSARKLKQCRVVTRHYIITATNFTNSVLVRRMLNINGRLSLRGTKQSPALGGEIAALRCAAFAMTRVQGAPDYHRISRIHEMGNQYS
jgi:hypothetical protein